MLLYIMSRPHSGSTILDILLGNTGEVESTGQLISDMGELDKPCACGATIRECELWKGVRQRVEAQGFVWDEVVRVTNRQAHIARLWQTFTARRNDPAMRRLLAMTQAIESAISQTLGKPVVCDSSKEPTRALFLLKYHPDVRMVHIVRDPRSAVASHYWRLKDMGHFHFLRRDYRIPWLSPFFLMLAALSWSVGNAISELVARQAPERVLRITYEDLRDHPVEQLRRLGRHAGIEVEDSVAKIEQHDTLWPGHIIGGNDVRLEQGLRFDPHKERKRRQPPRWVEPLTIAFCWPLMLRYGYGMRRRTPPSGTAMAEAGSGSPS